MQGDATKIVLSVRESVASDFIESESNSKSERERKEEGGRLMPISVHF
jgi:hypothetical protein